MNSTQFRSSRPFRQKQIPSSGEWEEAEKVYTEGTLFHAPKGERHGPHKAKTEVISLTHFDGPLTVEHPPFSPPRSLQ